MVRIKQETLNQLNKDSMNLDDLRNSIEMVRAFIATGNISNAEIDRLLELSLRIATR